MHANWLLGSTNAKLVLTTDVFQKETALLLSRPWWAFPRGSSHQRWEHTLHPALFLGLLKVAIQRQMSR